MKTLVAIAVVSLALQGCASHGRWAPTVDPRTSNSPDTLERDTTECKELALRVSGKAGKKGVKGAAVGAVSGAALGAILGAVSGNAGHGAAVGAAIGGTGGGALGTLAAEEKYKDAFIKCLEARGHRVLN